MKLETVACVLTALCWWINTELLSSRHTYSCSPDTQDVVGQYFPWGRCHGSNIYFSICFYFRDTQKLTPHQLNLEKWLDWALYVSQSLSWSTMIRNAWPQNLACWHFPFLLSFPEFSPDTLSCFTALLLTFWQEGDLPGRSCISLRLSLSSLCSSLVCKSQGKFGSVISGWPEPVFLRIILHRRRGWNLSWLLI